MSTQFKVGQRVAAYNCTRRHVGIVREWDTRRHPPTLVIETENDTLSFHPKQCRRLKPKAIKLTRLQLEDAICKYFKSNSDSGAIACCAFIVNYLGLYE